jgi:uncharacterized protein (TIGR02145 family)
MRKGFLLITLTGLLSFNNFAQSTVSDVDGNEYHTVVIGSQIWMKENLRTTKYNDGSSIINPGTDPALWQYNYNGAYTWFNNDSATYSNLYGALYNWYAVSSTTNGGRNICPLGWHVATHNDWTAMERAICTSGTCATDFPIDITTGGYRGTDEGGKLKDVGTTYWKTPNLSATNSSGFKALPGLMCDQSYTFSTSIGEYCWWWTSTSFDMDYAWIRSLNYNNAKVSRNHGWLKTSGLSVRCLNDVGLSLKENEVKAPIKIFPNPANNKVNLEILDYNNTTLEILNIEGRLLHTISLQSSNTTLDISDYPIGIYLIKVKSATNNSILKLIKN